MRIVAVDARAFVVGSNQRNLVDSLDDDDPPLVIAEHARRARLEWSDVPPVRHSRVEVQALYETILELELAARSGAEDLNNAKIAFLLARSRVIALGSLDDAFKAESTET